MVTHLLCRGREGCQPNRRHRSATSHHDGGRNQVPTTEEASEPE